MSRWLRQIWVPTLGMLLFVSPAWGQGDQPMPTPPGPEAQPAAAPASSPAASVSPPMAPVQGADGEEPGAVIPPPPPTKVAAVVAKGSTDAPVVRANNNWGFIWRLGGLARLTHIGNARAIGNGTAMTHIGIKYAPSETWMFPIYAGVAMTMTNPPGTDNSVTNFGIEFGGGVEYHFRIWRRISPFVGASAGFFYTNPTGDDTYDVGFGLGPVMGIEYYIADRLSLQALSTFVIAMAGETRPGRVPGGPGTDASTRTSFGGYTSVGGALNVTYYF